MSNYIKETPRLEIKFIEPETNELLFEVKGRDWMNVGEFFSDHYVTQLVKQTIKDKELPQNVMVLVIGNYKLM